MFVDFNRLTPQATFETEICIIGSGAAGLTVAREFFGTATRVTVIESGGHGFERAADALNAGQSIGLHFNGLTAGRRRQVGGATNIWGGVCVELDDSDFAYRSWIAGSGWPFTKAEVSPFYARARSLLALQAQDRLTSDWRDLGQHVPAFDPARVRYSIAATTPVSDLGKALRRELHAAPNVTLIVHATVTELLTNATGTAMQSVELQSVEGKRGHLRARTFILCCGGIENARLLLLSRSAHRTGLGNGYDLVGRHLTDHSLSCSGRIVPAAGLALQPMFRSLRRNGASVRPRLALAPELAARAGVLNCMAQVHFDYREDGAFAAAMELRKAVRFRRKPDNLRRSIRRVARDPFILAKMAVDRYLRGRHPADGALELRLECISEQSPNAGSRVTLARERDRFGLPQPCVDWRTDDIERRTIETMTTAAAAEFARLGLGSIEPESWLSDTRRWQDQLVDGYHHLGTTRMAASPRQGVVDADGNVHGVAGLYIAGSSIFPPAGYANSTLTIVALAIRLADHLKRTAHRDFAYSRGSATTFESNAARDVPARMHFNLD